MKKYLVIALFLAVSQFACNTTGPDPCATSYNQLALLENIGNNIIMPTYENYATQTDSLQAATATFVSSPSVSTLDILRNQFQATWLVWQKASIFEFGPAEDIELRSLVNNFPAFVPRMETTISDSTSYDLNFGSFHTNTRGFSALDYLLYGDNLSKADIVAKFSIDADATKRGAYLNTVADLIKQSANTVYDAWKVTGANYLNTFTSTEGVANGSPISNLVNQLNENYELIKNKKIGTPIGAKEEYIANPNNVEAYYSRVSLDLAIAAIEATKEVFTGGTGEGLDGYLDSVGVLKGSEKLSTLIINQYDDALSQLNAIKPMTWYDAILSDPTTTQAAYAVVQNQVVMTKTDMPSALCVSIVYIDNVNDGD